MDERRGCRPVLGGGARLRLALAATAGLALLGCEGTGGRLKHEGERGLTEIATWLPGTYDNVLQVRKEEAAGAPRREVVVVVVVPVYVPSIGDHVFFAEALLAADPQHVLSEQLLAFAVADDGTIVQTNYALKDPLRWRSGYLNPELFEGIQAPDLRGIVGCPLAWTRSDDRYTATSDPHTCKPRSTTKPGARPPRPAAPAGAKPPPGPMLAELTADEYSVVRRIPAADEPGATSGKTPAPGTADDPLEHYRKRLQ